jgi:hypothetical protein
MGYVLRGQAQIRREESRPSYLYALCQANVLSGYLNNHPLGQEVVLVLSAHYYPYKEVG